MNLQQTERTGISETCTEVQTNLKWSPAQS